jgi:lantibiotic modifying enzyme
MRKVAMQHDSSPPHAEKPQILALGYHGTLQPDPALHPANGASWIASPPQMETLIEPFLASAMHALDASIPEEQRTLSGERIPVDELLQVLRQRLQGILSLTVAAQLAAADKSATLTDRDLTQKFPALAPLLQQAVSDWVTALVTFHQRLQRDSMRVAQWLGLAGLPPIDSVSGTTTDMHPGGHVVLRVAFQGGRCIYYKPRAVTGEWLWHRLLTCAAEAEPLLHLPAGRVLEGSIPGRYGWMESVLPQNEKHYSSAPADPRHYWHAAGAMLCLAYHVSLTDLHLGNIVATLNGPAVTDAECLATPELSRAPAFGHSPDHAKFGTFLASLMATGLLPGRADHHLPDVSGLFGFAGPVTSLRLPRWSAEPDGQARLTMVPAALLDQGNTPGITSPLAVMPQLLAGYRHAADVLLRIRGALMASGSEWHSVLQRHHAPRIVVRDTLHYGLLLSRSLDPACLRSTCQRRHTLGSSLRENAPANFPTTLLRAELHSLLQLQVPRFLIPPGTRTLAGNSGRPLARNLARCAPAEEVTRRMEELSTENLETVHAPALLLAMLRAGGSAELR